MDIHKPKPMHNWREFAKEVGIIVLGVLIALGAEQVVQSIEWYHKTEAAEAAMRYELGSDDGPQILGRYMLDRCIDDALSAIRDGVEKGASRADVQRLIERHRTPFWTWDSYAFSSANDSEVALHIPGERMRRWTMAYATMNALNQANAKEFSDGADLVALSRTGGALSEAERSQMLRAVETLRRDNATIYASVRVALPMIAATGVTLDRKTVNAVREAGRRQYGVACEQAPPAS